MSSIRALARSDVTAAGRVLARAFRADPLIGVLLGGPGDDRESAPSLRHRVAFEAFFRTAIRDLLAGGRLDAAYTGRRLIGVAAWVPPRPTGPSNDLAVAIDRALVRILYPRGSRRIETGFAAIAPLHPAEPHWYLEFVGVEPGAQGHGVGGTLLAPALAAADASGYACYLETPFATTIPFYRRLGFEVQREVPDAFGGLGPLWTLIRRPSMDHSGT